MSTAFILLPNNLFRDCKPLTGSDTVFLVEEFLFFRQYRFHKQKLIFQRASMKAYEDVLVRKGFTVRYINCFDPLADIRQLIPHLAGEGFSTIRLYDPTDEWLEQRTRKACRNASVDLQFIENPLFINDRATLTKYQEGRKKYYQSDFYIAQRKLRKILVDADANPLHGKWSFDTENRARYPAGKKPPVLLPKYDSGFQREAAAYVETHFASNPGQANPDYFYPVTHEQARQALHCFFEERFAGFGIYEDAMVAKEIHLHHSVLSPLLNSGLLVPLDVVEQAIAVAEKKNIPFNSVEGFVRQVLGWREFVRMLYIREGNRQRTCNFWQFSRKIPSGFYTGTTGIKPVDETIGKLLKSAYNHHIERLMILSNFMLLCEFDPDEVYRWFMEMYIDAYDWVMVPNVYGMGQFADGGLMCTKPYISGSNYILKMSDYRKGEAWAGIWDALFWRFLHVHRHFFLQNPRLRMLIRTFDKWEEPKKRLILEKAAAFLVQLDASPLSTK